MLRRRMRRSVWVAGAVAISAIAMGAIAPAATAGQGADRIAATVNGENILEAEFMQRLQYMRWQNFVLTTNPLRFRNETAGQLLLNALIEERLILQWADKTKQMPSAEEVKKELDQLRERPDIKALLAEGLLPEPFLERETRAQLARFNIATTAASVSQKDAESWYQKNIARFSTPERIGLAVLRTLKPDAVPKIQDGLKDNKPFEELVKAYSDEEASKARGGLLGVVPVNDPGLPPPILAAVKPLKAGQVAGPIKIEVAQGPNRPSVVTFWFVRLVSREPAKSRPFEEVKAQVERAALLEQAGGIEVADKKIAEFRKTSDVKILLRGYQNLLAPKTEEKKP